MSPRAPVRGVVATLPARPRVLLLSLALLLLAAPPAEALPEARGVVSGTGGIASAFQIFGSGVVVRGGLFTEEIYCNTCLARFVIAGGDFRLLQDGALQTLVPGTYELRGYGGFIFVSDEAPHRFHVVLQGVGHVVRLPDEAP